MVWGTHHWITVSRMNAIYGHPRDILINSTIFFFFFFFDNRRRKEITNGYGQETGEFNTLPKLWTFRVNIEPRVSPPYLRATKTNALNVNQKQIAYTHHTKKSLNVGQS